jgi:hypothetical protein
LGSCAEMAGSFLVWLAEQQRPDRDALQAAADHLIRCAEMAKTLQFTLARAARGRVVNVEPLLDDMSAAWGSGITLLADRAGQ